MKQPAVAALFNQTEVAQHTFYIKHSVNRDFPLGILREECADMCIYLLSFHRAGCVVAILH